MSYKGGVGMVVNQKATGRAVSFPAGLLIGLGVSLGITVAMGALTAYLEGKEALAENGVGYCAMLTLAVSSLAGAMTAAGKIKRIRFGVCMLSAACYFLSLIGATALFFGGQYTAVGVTGLLILGGSAAAGFLDRKGKRNTSVRIKKLKNR